jgi:hypothetical protein
MARRKSFGSPVKVHRGAARESTKAARWWFKELRRQVKSGNCYAALDALVTANRMSASATVERRGAGKRAMFQATTLRSAMERFARVCMVRRK